MRKLRILVDMDGIVADFIGGLWEEIGLDFGELVASKCSAERIVDFYGLERGVAPEHRAWVGNVDDYFRRAGFFYGLKPIEGALDALRDLIDAGHEVCIVTSPCTPASAMEKMQWLKRNAPFIPADQVFICKKKHYVVGDVLIDDAPHNADSYKAVWQKSFVATLGYAYNRDCKSYDFIADHRAPDAWQKIVAAISEFSAS